MNAWTWKMWKEVVDKDVNDLLRSSASTRTIWSTPTEFNMVARTDEAF